MAFQRFSVLAVFLAGIALLPSPLCANEPSAQVGSGETDGQVDVASGDEVEPTFDHDADVISADDANELDILPLDELVDAPLDTLPEEFQDPAFERFVDLHLIGSALADRDAGLLTDAALQLAEGERVLLRSHISGLSAERLLSKAAILAAETHDDTTLQRLAKAAEATHNQNLIGALQGAQKLTGESREAKPALMLPLDSSDVDSLVKLKVMLDVIDDAKAFQDTTMLDTIAEDAAGLPENQKQAIANLIDRARAEIQAAGSTEDDALLRLASVSRGWPNVNIKPPKLPTIKPPKLPTIKPPKWPPVRPPKLPDLRPPADELWGEMGRLAIPAAASVMAARNANRRVSSIARRDREALRPYFGSVVDDVRIYWGADPLNSWSHGSCTIRLGGADAGAQTYGKRIYIRYGMNDLSDYQRLKLLIHELTHVQQYVRYRSYSGFGYQYFKYYKRANQSYAGNKLEVEAERAESQLIGRVKQKFASR